MHDNTGQSVAEIGELEAHRACLLKVAQLQLKDASLAEDVVQDTLEAAVRNRQTFRGNASRRTWLTGILRHKLADAFRLQNKHAAPLAALTVPEHLRCVDASFAPDGAWSKAPNQRRLVRHAESSRSTDVSGPHAAAYLYRDRVARPRARRMSELHCPKATRLLSDAQDRKLSDHEQEMLDSHLTICPGCARFAEQLRLIRAFVKRWRENA